MAPLSGTLLHAKSATTYPVIKVANLYKAIYHDSLLDLSLREAKRNGWILQSDDAELTRCWANAENTQNAPAKSERRPRRKSSVACQVAA